MVGLTYVQSSDDDDMDELRSDRDAVTPAATPPSFPCRDAPAMQPFDDVNVSVKLRCRRLSNELVPKSCRERGLVESRLRCYTSFCYTYKSGKSEIQIIIILCVSQCVCVCVCAVSYTHLTLPTIYSV